MKRSVRMKISGLMAVVLVVAVGLAALRSGSAIWAGACFLLTCGVLALAAVGSVFDTRGTRAWWLGIAIFGCGYLVLAFSYPPFLEDAPFLPADSLLRFAMPYVGPGPSWLPGAHGLADNPYLQTGHCLLGLLAGTLGGVLAHALSVRMRFPQGKPLRELLAYVVSATRSPDGHEIPIYLNPGSVDDMEKTLQTPVKIDLEGVRLRTTLELALEQCELLYTVKGGVIIVTSGSDSPDSVPIASSDPFLAIGQSLLALPSAGVGGVLAALVYNE
jgi:hypothetical protein